MEPSSTLQHEIGDSLKSFFSNILTAVLPLKKAKHTIKIFYFSMKRNKPVRVDYGELVQ